MALYLVVHTPQEEDDDRVQAPSRLKELAQESADHSPIRWIKTWSPDLHDERIFSLWEAPDAAEIESALDRYGFLNERTARALRVREWGPEDVLAAEES